MREDGGRVVLMDFGAGHEAQPQTRADVNGRDITGTPLYMAPELFAGARADRRTDIYALGALLFYLVTGRFPSRADRLPNSAMHTRARRAYVCAMSGPICRAIRARCGEGGGGGSADRFQTAGALEAALPGNRVGAPRRRP